MAAQNGNGHGPHLAAAGGVPILGQPFEVSGLLVTTTMVCKCSARGHALFATSSGVTICPGCGRGYMVHAVAWQRGQPPQIQIGMVAPEGDAMTSPRVG